MPLRPPRLSRALLVAFLALGGCAQRPFVIPPGPGPSPVPVPTPTPSPTIEGHVVTPAEFEAVALGSTEAALVARFGQPVRIVPLADEGVKSYVYHASLPTDSTRLVSFWFRSGLLVNKVNY